MAYHSDKTQTKLSKIKDKGQSPGDSGPGLPEDSPVLSSQSFSLWRKLLTIGRYPQTLASTVLTEGQTREHR